MDRIVCYIPSYNDSAQAEQSLASSRDWDVVISDNHSDEPHASALAALAGPRVTVIRQGRPLGRVGNARFCVEHFIASGATWMKVLSAGDRHKPDALAIFRRAIARYPDARFFVGQIEHIYPSGPALWKIADVDSIMHPPVAMELIVLNGNIFHSAIAPLVHVEMVRDGFAFGEDILSYCADLLFLMGIGKKTPTYYLAEIVAEMVMEHRQTYRAKSGTLECYLEEGLMRLRAADAVLALTGDRAKRDRLAAIVADLVQSGAALAPQTLAGRPPNEGSKPS
jgi:hypothetical protein